MVDITTQALMNQGQEKPMKLVTAVKWWGSGQVIHTDECEGHVITDVNAVDLVQLSYAMLELQHLCVVHCNLEFIVSAQDFHLKWQWKHVWNYTKQVKCLTKKHLI